MKNDSRSNLISILISPKLNAALGEKLETAIEATREQLNSEGFLLPEIDILCEPSLFPDEYQVIVRDLAIGKAEVHPDRVLIHRRDWDSIYADPPMNCLPGWDPSPQEAAYWVEPEVLKLSDWDRSAESPTQVVTNHFAALMRVEADSILRKVDLNNMLRETQDFDPDLVKNILSNRKSLAVLRQALANLLKEGVVVHDMHLLLEKFEDLFQEDDDPYKISEQLRRGLSRSICNSNSTPDRQMPGISFHPDIEKYLLDNLEMIEGRSKLVLTMSEIGIMASQIEESSNRILDQIDRRPVFVCGGELRLPLLILLNKLVKINVIALEELHPDYHLQVMETIGLQEVQSEA